MPPFLNVSLSALSLVHAALLRTIHLSITAQSSQIHWLHQPQCLDCVCVCVGGIVVAAAKGSRNFDV